MNIHRIIRNEELNYYHLMCYMGHEKIGFEELQEKFAELGFTGYEWLNYERGYVIHFSDPSTEAQFLLYFNDIIRDDITTLTNLSDFRVLGFY